ncbi:hypothetical protein TOPB45_0618 [Thermodesulfobacterium geofontis OPF15]|jgi:hypothetical protein|uniref:Uncharacterized protein n=1 Tax=Thermodesulfobacterium geofontis (strain OPF15) TaxID=795359 RepID=F8C4Q0_THEGP|nr:hypothetical protein [Thermodesulfobacterium geofontis]AEH22720.1 hypothetical protein TOPB45_0618 [Thermodesulfobacterium geofontis OPF15]
MKFYTLEWINEVFKRYKDEEGAFFIEDKEVGFKPQHFLWALLHIYSKKEIPFIGDTLNIKDLEFLLQHQEFDFMYLVDLLRKEFALWFRENILNRDFSEESYFILAQEFLLLEEQLRKQIQIPLLDKMKKLILDLEEIVEEKKPIEEFEKKKNKFFRLIKFFSIVEKIETTKCSELVERAKNIVEKAYKSSKAFEIFPSLPSQIEFKKALKEEFNKLFVPLS